MKFTDAKNEHDITLTGVISAEIEWHDKTAKAITFSDREGHVVKIAGQYGIDILVPAPPTMVEVWRVSGRIPGIQDAVLEYFEYEHRARDRVATLGRLLSITLDLKVAKVSVTEDEAAAHKPSAEAEFDPETIPF